MQVSEETSITQRHLSPRTDTTSLLDLHSQNAMSTRDLENINTTQGFLGKAKNEVQCGHILISFNVFPWEVGHRYIG